MCCCSTLDVGHLTCWWSLGSTDFKRALLKSLATIWMLSGWCFWHWLLIKRLVVQSPSAAVCMPKILGQNIKLPSDAFIKVFRKHLHRKKILMWIELKEPSCVKSFECWDKVEKHIIRTVPFVSAGRGGSTSYWIMGGSLRSAPAF